MNDLIKHYMSNSMYSITIFAILVLVGLYLSRNILKNIFASIVGYRKDVDDHALAIHANKDIYIQNQMKKLETGLNFKNALLIVLSIYSVLISPIIFLIIFSFYAYQNAKEKIKNVKNFKFFDFKTDDKFVKFLNEKSEQLNVLVDEFLFANYAFLIVGTLSGSSFLFFCGIFGLLIVAVATIVLFVNAIAYKMNYKYVEYYRIVKLLNSSHLVGKKSLLAISFISFISVFTKLEGYSIYLWSILLIDYLIQVSIYAILKREDDISIEHQDIENRDYRNIHKIASYPNPLSQSRGYKFTTLLQMKFFEIEKKKKGKNLLYLDNYSFYPQTINRTILRQNPLLKNKLTKAVKVFVETLDLTKQILVLGGMGSGKTELVNKIVEQVHESNFTLYKAITFNDEAGDFVNKFYREEKDIIVSLFDERALAWDIFEEMKYNAEAGTAFIENLFEALQGKEKDFFNASAKIKTTAWLKESYFATNNSKDAWEMFFQKIKKYEEKIKETDDKTQSSILATIQIALDTLYLMYYQIVVEKRKTFTLYEYVRSENKQLFFLNNPQFETKSIGYMTGVQAAYLIAATSKTQDEILDKKHLILNVFDEFLSMQNRLDDPSIKILLTKIRKFLFCNILMAQYLPKDEKLIQDIDSSRYAMITFNINDDYTLEQVSKKLADQECLMLSNSPKQEKQDEALGVYFKFLTMSPIGELISPRNKKNISSSLSNTKVMLAQQLQSMPKYHHLTFIPSEETQVLNKEDIDRFFKLMAFGYEDLIEETIKDDEGFLSRESGILYLGYTPQSKLTYNNKSFVNWDMKNYYKFMIKKAEKEDEENIFKDEKEEFIHYLNMKFSNSTEDAKKYALEHNLDKFNINKIFANVEENPQKIEMLKLKYSEEERYELMEQFFEIDSSDLDAKYEFCKKHDLIGGILGIFELSKDFLEEKMKGVKIDN